MHIHTVVTCWLKWGTSLVCCVNILAWRVTSSEQVAVSPVANVGNSLLFIISREWLKFVRPQKRRSKLLPVGRRKLLEYRTVGGVAFACPIRRIFCFITKQSIFLKLTLLHNDTTETYSSCIHMLKSLQMVAVLWGTELPDVKFCHTVIWGVCIWRTIWGTLAVSLPWALHSTSPFFLSFKSEVSYLSVDRQGNRSILTIFVCAPQRCECV